jgi:hypothetical protein
MIASMMLTIVMVTSWLGENNRAPGPPVEFKKTPSGSKPDSALAHYELNHGMGAFSVFEDRIEVMEPTKKTIIAFSGITNIREDRDMPSAVFIEYMSEHGTRMTYTFMMFRDDDMIKAEDARDIDRLIALLEKQQSAIAVH